MATPEDSTGAPAAMGGGEGGSPAATTGSPKSTDDGSGDLTRHSRRPPNPRRHASLPVVDLSPFESPTAPRTKTTWNLYFHCKGTRTGDEFVNFRIERRNITFGNLVTMKSQLGYSGRDYLYYKKRCGRAAATLEDLDYEVDADSMIENNEGDKKIRLVLSREEERGRHVNITPMKLPNSAPTFDDECTEEPIDEYKDWLANLHQEEVGTEFQDNYRDETIATYSEWLRLQGDLDDIKSYLQNRSLGTQRTGEDESQDNNPTPTLPQPSHARRQKQQGNDKKRGRGTLKGLAAVSKRIKQGNQKLKIEFSSRLGGPVGENARTFVDEVVMFTRKKAPLIGVRSWKDVKQVVKNSIANDIMNRWDIENSEDTKLKIWAIAKERYKGWRSTFSSTYKAYRTYDERMQNKPEDLDIVEWHYLVLYFGTEQFKKISSQNSQNRHLQQTKHLMGSKPFSQCSYEQRDPETGEEPNDLSLWMTTHTKHGQWSNSASKAIYDTASSKITEKELESQDNFISSQEENFVFQSSYKESTRCKSSKTHGNGYLAYYPTRRQLYNENLQMQARHSAESHRTRLELQSEVQMLKEQLANQVAERANEKEESRRQIEELLNSRDTIKEELRQEFMSMLGTQRQGAFQEGNQAANETIHVPAAPTERNDTTPRGEETTPQTNPDSNLETQHEARRTAETNNRTPRSSVLNRTLPQNKDRNASVNYITTKTLKAAVATKRARTRSQQETLYASYRQD